MVVGTLGVVGLAGCLSGDAPTPTVQSSPEGTRSGDDTRASGDSTGSVGSPTPSATETDARTATTAESNLTEYPTAHPSAEGGPFHGATVSLPPDGATVRLVRSRREWASLRRAIAARLDDRFVAFPFADRTTFDAESLVFFETRTPGRPARLQLRRVAGVGDRSVRLRVFCTVGPLNAVGHRTLFVRLPDRGTVPTAARVEYRFEGDEETAAVTTRRPTPTD